MRQKEFERFNEIKPLLEITDSSEGSKFEIKNHGSIAYYIGCRDDKVGRLLIKTPRRYSTLSNKAQGFEFSTRLSDKQSIICYWRDIDLNTYEVEIIHKNQGFYLSDPPATYRSDIHYTIPTELLDKIVSIVFSKDWFIKNENPPTDDSLIVNN
ncbi:hypothetical protein JYT31_00845 [Beggiatoa alba]|nr:hypothetical protein [Beggiatoa alba]